MTSAPRPAAVPRPAALLGLVALGGAIGVAGRAALILPLQPDAVVLATVAVNVTGSLLLGVVVGWLDGRHPRARAFLGTGVLGGFTTYSAFAAQTVTTATSEPWSALGVIAASVALGLAGAVAGLFIGRRIADVPGEIEPPESAE